MTSKSGGIVHSKRRCCVDGCSNSEARNYNLKFYRFPGRKWETERKRKWIDAIKRTNKKNELWEPTINSRVCSAHFVKGKKSDNANCDSYVPSIFPNIDGNNYLTSETKCWNMAQRPFECTEIVEVTLTEVHYDDVETNKDLITHRPEENKHYMENIAGHDGVNERLETKTTGCQTDSCIEIGIDEMFVLFCWNGNNDASTQTKVFREKQSDSQKSKNYCQR